MSEPTKDEVPEAFRQAYRDTIDLCDDPGCDMDCERIMAEDMANYWREDGDGPGYFFRRGQAACGHQGATYHDGYDQGWKEAHVLSIPACHPLASSPEARAESVVMHRHRYSNGTQQGFWHRCWCPPDRLEPTDEHASFLRSSPGTTGKGNDADAKRGERKEGEK